MVTSTEPTNETRAERGKAVIWAYCVEHGEADDATTMRDILADLMHACGLEAVREAMQTAERHFREETSAGHFGFVEDSSAMLCPKCGQENDVTLRREGFEVLERSDYDDGSDDPEYLAFDLGYGNTMDDNAESTFIRCAGCGYEDSADHYSIDLV